MTPKIRCRTSSPGLGSHGELNRHRGAAEQHCRQRPRGRRYAKAAAAAAPHHDGSKQLEPGQQLDSRSASAPTRGVTVPVINGAVPSAHPSAMTVSRHD
jgi:hypothetical protein